MGLSTGAAVAAAFNLLCTGVVTQPGDDEAPSKPYSIIYRIDLGQSKYCEDECRIRSDIREVQQARITLQEQGDRGPRSDHYLLNVIERDTGEQTIIETIGRVGAMTYYKHQGSCERQPFTGFPTPKTKF